jgi:predicted HicB family RNase H-like nuclease
MKDKKTSYHSGKEGTTTHNLHGHLKENGRIAVIDFCKQYAEGKDITATEIAYYKSTFKDWLQCQTEKYKKKGNKKRIKTMAEIHTSKRYRPTETIIQYGNVKSAHKPTEKDFCDMIWELEQKKLEWSRQHGGNLVLLNCALHFDEATPHAHERTIWRYKDENGMWCIGQEKAMEQAGIPLPNPAKPVGKYNNRCMQFTAICRGWWQDICEAHGYEVDKELLPPRSHKSVKDYQYDCNRKAMEQAEKDAGKALRAREDALRAREQALQAREQALRDKEESYKQYSEKLLKRIEKLVEREKEFKAKQANYKSYIIRTAKRIAEQENMEFAAKMSKQRQTEVLQRRLDMLGELPQFEDYGHNLEK